MATLKAANKAEKAAEKKAANETIVDAFDDAFKKWDKSNKPGDLLAVVRAAKEMIRAKIRDPRVDQVMRAAKAR